MDKESVITEHIKALAKQIGQLNEDAYQAYKPLVDDICSRKASRMEVERLLDGLFSFAEDNRALELFKRVCRNYWQTYPDSIAFYIMEYRKWYDPESLIGSKYEYLLDELPDFDE